MTLSYNIMLPIFPIQQPPVSHKSKYSPFLSLQLNLRPSSLFLPSSSSSAPPKRAPDPLCSSALSASPVSCYALTVRFGAPLLPFRSVQLVLHRFRTIRATNRCCSSSHHHYSSHQPTSHEAARLLPSSLRPTIPAPFRR